MGRESLEFGFRLDIGRIPGPPALQALFEPEVRFQPPPRVWPMSGTGQVLFGQARDAGPLEPALGFAENLRAPDGPSIAFGLEQEHLGFVDGMVFGIEAEASCADNGH